MYEGNSVRSPRLSPSISLCFLLLAATCGLSGTEVPKAKLSPCALTATEIAGLGGDAGADIHAVSDYQKTISNLLRAGKFKQLDCLADSARSHREMFSGGTWKLHTIYVALEDPPLHATPQDWKAHIGLLKQWVSAKPHSITVRGALAEAYVNPHRYHSLTTPYRPSSPLTIRHSRD